MKTFVAILAVCAAGVLAAEPGITDEQKAKLKEYRESCVKDTSVDGALIENLKKGEEIKFDEKLNCFSACMLKKLAIMKQDGTIDEEIARSKIPASLPKEKADEIINTCKTQVGNTPCETGGKVLGCLLKTQAITLFI